MLLKTHNAAGWTIRRVARTDFGACERILLQGISGFHWYGKRAQMSLKRNNVLMLRGALREGVAWVAAEPQAGVVGFITLYPREAYVHYLFVDQDWTLCGVAGGLIAHARAYAGRPLELKTDAPNRRARDAYARLGWKETGERGNGGGGVDWVRMRSR